MTNLDSRTTTVREGVSVYISSAPALNNWGQPPVSHHVLKVDGVRLHGQLIENPAGAYVTSPGENSASSETPVSYALAQELESWQAAASEALADFEAQLADNADNNEDGAQQV